LILGDIGSPAVMHEQLDKLAGLVREPGVVIQVLPFTARVQHQITGQSICQKGGHALLYRHAGSCDPG
jgi:hypothetical protein